MKSLLIGCVAAATIATAIPAGAADLRLPTKAPPMAPVAVNTWTGCYIGANIGGGWASEGYRDPTVIPADDLGSHSISGIIGGGQIGCDYQMGPWVFGVQGMFDGTGVRGSHLDPDNDVLATRIPWFATATGRIGYTLQPSLLAYLKGGVAWKRQEETVTDLVTGLPEGIATVNRWGWVIGGGFEYQFTRNWSFFVEGDYMDFGTRTLSFTNLELPAVPPTFPLDIREKMWVAMAGVNFRFGP